MQNHNEETLIHLHPKTDAERLVWERHANRLLTKEIKELNVEIGVLKSELDELRHLMKTEQVGALILKNKLYKEQSIENTNRIRELKKENTKLFDRLVSLQAKHL
jgi:hypothetical protein